MLPAAVSEELTWADQAGLVRARYPALAALALGQGFVVTRAQAGQAVGDAAVRRYVRHGSWSVPRRGTICPLPCGDQLGATAAALVRPGHVISHRSAAQLHALPLLPWVRTGPELSHPKIAYTRHGDDLVVRTASIGPRDRTRWFGAEVTKTARTVVDLARLDRREGLIAADAALHAGWLRPAALEAALARAAGLPGIVEAREVLAYAETRTESVLESLTRLCLIDHHVPPPEPQFVIGPWRVDFCWPGRRTILEADGMGKYVGDALWDEKLRQEALERLDFRVVRVTWDDIVRRPDDTVARIWRALRHA